MSERISKAELERIERVDQACIPSRGTQHDDPDNSGLCIYCGKVLDEEGAVGRLVAEVRRLRALVVAQADLGCCSMHERCEGGCGAELVEAEAKAIRAESAPKGPGTEAGTRARPGS